LVQKKTASSRTVAMAEGDSRVPAYGYAEALGRIASRI
jgi:hypothetical protein